MYTITGANVTVMVSDMDAAVEFYKSLGLELKQRWGNHYAQLAAPGVVIGLHPTGDKNVAGSSGNVSIGFTADNFDEATTFLKNLSINVQTREEEGGQFLHFNDPDGTALYFIKPKW